MAVTARRIRSAIRRFKFERSELDTCLALAGCHRERPLPWRKPRNGLAARRVGRIDGKEFACLVGRARAADRRPFAGNAAGDPALCATGHADRVAAPDTDWREPPCYFLWYLPPS